MIAKKIVKAFNAQINAELYSSYLYLSMSAWFETQNLPGFANWMRIQAMEETGHAMKFFTHINERGGAVTLDGIDTPQATWKSPLDAFKGAFAHEQKVSGLINKLADLAVAEKDHASTIFLQWFVTEQVEEEQSADSVVQKLAMAGDSPQALLMMDGQMAARTYVHA